MSKSKFPSTLAVTITLFFSVCVISARVWGVETDEPAVRPQVVLQIGAGQVKIETQGLDLSSDQIERLKTELMVSEQISDAVTAESVNRMVLEGAAIEHLAERLKHAHEQAGEEIKNLVFSHLKAGGETPAERVRHQVDDRVAIGQSVSVSADERIKEVVVIGGEVKVYGEVDHLVVIGGIAKVFAGARINNELVAIGSTVFTDDLAEIHGERVEISLPHSPQEWSALGRSLKTSRLGMWYSSWWSILPQVIFAWIFLTVLNFLLDTVAKPLQFRIQRTFGQNKLRSFVWAVLSALGFVPFAILLLVSLVGIPLLPLHLLLGAFLAVVGYLHSTRWLGSRIGAMRDSPTWAHIAVGLVALKLLALVPVVGGLLVGVLWALGCGATLRAVFSGFSHSEV